jgi:gluconolactonase
MNPKKILAPVALPFAVCFAVIAACLLVPMALAVAAQDNQVPKLPPAPANPPARSLQAASDSGYAAETASCKVPPKPFRLNFGGPGPSPRDYSITAIPGVIAAGQHWKFVWQAAGNNGDGIVGTNDGGLLIAQNDNSQVIKLDKNGQPSIAYTDTHTGGAVSISTKGVLFIDERGLHAAIWELAPEHKLLADTYNGETLDCIPGVLNDLVADSKGGAYFSMGGLFYASPAGVVTKYGDNLRTNGIILSPDEKKLYVTNVGTVVVFDVQPDGSLANQRDFAQLAPKTAGDGSTVDADGRLYVSTDPGVQVIAADGAWLGLIPTPRPIISVAFGGRDKRTLFILARGAEDSTGQQIANAAQIYTIQMLARGYKRRPK